MERYIIVHPKDSSTTFLEGLYLHLPNKTVITGCITKTDLRKEIQSHGRVILCGHGSPQGLLSVGQFPGSGLYIIDETMVSALRNKNNPLYIWCRADNWMYRQGLNTGFHTGMFLSQMSECLYFGVECTEEDIIESNIVFAETVARHINEPPIVFYKNVLIEYGRLRQNSVARYNSSRLFLNHYEPHLFFDKVDKIQ